jgi:hypothetical protein
MTSITNRLNALKNMTPAERAERAARRDAMSERAAMQEAYRAKFKRQHEETKGQWKARIWAAIADIHTTLKLHDHDSAYSKRLYLELDEARSAYVQSIRTAR